MPFSVQHTPPVQWQDARFAWLGKPEICGIRPIELGLPSFTLVYLLGSQSSGEDSLFAGCMRNAQMLRGIPYCFLSADAKE
ncbi:hypothetical protein NPIL_448571 [Nephila pilipes]|uniref:Uncharacterized protein n=1 Tax=Nephila pilipes TaxID=299642 RepID=A0A8X6MF37_NEPPI|nr:hypothetical protein NPIL_448571 [Nephila pilipes]